MTENRDNVGKCKSAFGPVFYISKWLSARPRITKNETFSDIFTTFCYQKTHRKKSDEKNGFLSIFGPFRGPKVTPKTIKMGDGDWVLVFWEQHNSLFGPPGRPGVDFGAFWMIFSSISVDFWYHFRPQNAPLRRSDEATDRRCDESTNRRIDQSTNRRIIDSSHHSARRNARSD